MLSQVPVSLVGGSKVPEISAAESKTAIMDAAKIRSGTIVSTHIGWHGGTGIANFKLAELKL